jgi:hypothetical protein
LTSNAKLLIVAELEVKADLVILNQDLDHIRQWLSPCDPSSNYANALATKHKGSGEWLLHTHAYQRWKENSDPDHKILWLHGKMGCGKTVLSSTVIEDMKRPSDNSAVPLLYFYFDFRDPEKQLFVGIVRCFIWQLSYQSAIAQHSLKKLYEDCKGGAEQPTLDQLVSTLQDALLLSGRVHIVLDAMDECSTRPDLLAWISMVQLEMPEVSLLATSRAEPEIKIKMDPLSAALSLENGFAEEDIAKYIEHTVRSKGSFGRWQQRPGVQEEIISTLVKKADKM